MSREVRRVPVNHGLVEIGDTWTGYFMPETLHESPCPGVADGICDRGATYAASWLMQMARLILQLDDDRSAAQRGRPMHPYFNGLLAFGLGAGPTGQGRPSSDIEAVGTGLAGRSASPFGHDSIDAWNAYAALRKAAAVPEGWGVCPICHGHGSVEAYPGQRAEAEAWQAPEFPVGPGWQMWQTVSEGGPVSPVYETPEDLARWMLSDRWAHLTFEEALRWVTEVGSSFGSFVATADGVADGVTAAAAEQDR